jgi:hypothetical protein
MGSQPLLDYKNETNHMASKKIIVRNTSLEDDEHTYYAIIFIQPDITMNKRLKFNNSIGKLEARFTFWSESPLAVGEKFLVILVSVEESEETDAINHQIPASIAGDNIIEFDFHP